MDSAGLKREIEAALEERERIGPDTGGRRSATPSMAALDGWTAALRVAEKVGGGWHTHQWLKKAVLLSFRLNRVARDQRRAGRRPWWDKVPSKFAGWAAARFQQAGFRAVPGASSAAPPTSARTSC